MEYPTHFQSNEKTLYGIFHLPEPEVAKQKVGVIFFPAGVKYRVGPHRLYVKIARRLQEHGYPCFRVDTHGIGDSEDNLEYGPIAKVWATIETGRFVEDALAAIDHFCTGLKLDKVILTGLCGGANTALLSALKDSRIAHLILIGMSAFISSPVEDFSDKLNPGMASIIFEMYLKKLLTIKYWRRLLTFQSDYKLLIKSLGLSLFKRTNHTPLNTKSAANSDQDNTQRFNIAQIDNLRKFISPEKNVLFILSENDPAHWDFLNLIEKPYLQSRFKKNKDYEIVVIPAANHMLFLPEWQSECTDRIISWLDLRHS